MCHSSRKCSIEKAGGGLIKQGGVGDWTIEMGRSKKWGGVVEEGGGQRRGVEEEEGG